MTDADISSGEDDVNKVDEWGFKVNDLRDRIAKSIYGSGVERSRKFVSELDLQVDRIRTVMNAALGDSDRSSAILMFALVEDLMLEAFKKYLDDSVKGGWDSITGGNGLLATAHDRITLLVMLRWIGQETYQDLLLLKSIRNRFAHHADVSSCNDVKIKSWIYSFKFDERALLTEVVQKAYPEGIKLLTRDVFLIRSCQAISRLVYNVAVSPISIINRVEPRHVSWNKYDETPENFKSFELMIADIICRVYEYRAAHPT